MTRINPPTRLPFWILGISLTLSAVFVLYGGFRAFYFQSSFLAPIAYTTDERPTAEVYGNLLGVAPAELLSGIHVFFDFLISYYWGTLENPWFDDPTGFPVNYPPASMVFLELWAQFPYKTALSIYLPLMALCLLLPTVIALRGTRWSLALLASSVTLLSGPAIASLDRGNTQGFIPILLFGFALLALKGRWGWASVFLVLATSLKLFPAVILLVLIAERRWRALIGSLIALLMINTLGFLLYPGNPVDSFRAWLAAAFTFLGRDNLAGFLEYNASFTGGLAHGLIVIGLTDAAPIIESQARVITIFVTAILAVVVLLRNLLPLAVRIFAAFMMTTTLLPVAYPYTANWVIAGSAMMFWLCAPALRVSLNADNRASSPPELESLSLSRDTVWFGIAVASGALLSFGPVFIPGTMESGYRAGVASLIMPIAVAVFILTALMSAWTQYVSQRHDPSSAARAR